jgi:hypothetical protein
MIEPRLAGHPFHLPMRSSLWDLSFLCFWLSSLLSRFFEMKERIRWRCWGLFFLCAGGDQEDSDVNVGVLDLLLAFVSVFALYTVFFVSVF